jgi:uncharacterized protein (TIGR03083 family)
VVRDDEIWDVVVAERAALASVLAGLTEAEWDHPSLCAGWRVRDVAAHLIAGPQLTWPKLLATMPAMLRYGFNGMILRDGRRRGDSPVADILGQYARYGPLRRGPVVVGPREALIDALVHPQDILRPLGRTHTPAPESSAVAADQARDRAKALGSVAIVRAARFEATDADWARGDGAVVAGPMLELLMLSTGRAPDWEQLTGDGLGGVRHAVAAGR